MRIGHGVGAKQIHSCNKTRNTMEAALVIEVRHQERLKTKQNGWNYALSFSFSLVFGNSRSEND
jgi:hypothetical protein